jgi:hypothetical protein
LNPGVREVLHAEFCNRCPQQLLEHWQFSVFGRVGAYLIEARRIGKEVRVRNVGSLPPDLLPPAEVHRVHPIESRDLYRSLRIVVPAGQAGAIGVQYYLARIERKEAQATAKQVHVPDDLVLQFPAHAGTSRELTA